MATTLVVSDLHLGGRTGADVLRRAGPRAALLNALADVDRLVLLGDVLELRHGPPREVLGGADEALRAIGAAMAGREIVLTAGNHDHALVRGWLQRRGRDEAPAPLELEHRFAPAQGSWIAERVAGALGVSCELAYPGLWLRDDVYATHGHHLDLHSTVPNFERLAAGVATRVSGPLPESGVTPDDYEARLAPIYAWVDAVAEHARDERAAGGAGSAQRAFRLLTGGGGRSLRGLLAMGAFPVGIAALNRAGLGPVSANLSGPSLRRATLAAMEEVVRRLQIEAAHVVFGHSHRTGPLPGDAGYEWQTASGPRLHNTGSWVFETHFLSGPDGSSPYWPGGAVRIADGEPPRLERLLGDRSAAELRG